MVYLHLKEPPVLLEDNYQIVKEIVEMFDSNMTIDWGTRKDVRIRVRIKIKNY